MNLRAVVAEETLLADADPARLQQALGNLIDDALRANLKSDIRVEISRAPLPDENAPACAQVEVAYRAAVIEPKRLRGYFEQFYQREENQEMRSENRLGLAISKLLVNAHGGNITIESDTRRGTLVKFTLPMMESGD